MPTLTPRQLQLLEECYQSLLGIPREDKPGPAEQTFKEWLKSSTKRITDVDEFERIEAEPLPGSHEDLVEHGHPDMEEEAMQIYDTIDEYLEAHSE
jgi:hypothetical protein